MSTTVTRDAEGTVTGNTYDKYGSTNPVVRRLMTGFERSPGRAVRQADAALDPRRRLRRGRAHPAVGDQRLAPRRPRGRHRPRGPGDPGRVGHATGAPNLDYQVMKAEQLPFGDGEFETSRAPSRCSSTCPTRSTPLAEMARVASRHLLVSVPREPLWRTLNVARGAYLRELGNTPGHLNHWSKRAFVELLERHGEVVEARSPFPWTMLLVRRPLRRGVAPVSSDGGARRRRHRARRPRLRARRAHPLDRDRHHRPRHLRLLLRSPANVLSEVGLQGPQRCCGR